jgi:hypothetical protein
MLVHLGLLKGIGTAYVWRSTQNSGDKLELEAIKIEALDTAEGFWKSQGFRRLKGAEIERKRSTYDMTIDADTVQALAKEISS